MVKTKASFLSAIFFVVVKLKGFKRINLKPGESGTVNFRINSDELALWNRQMKKVVEPGEFKIMIGSSSQDIRLKDSFWVMANK